MHHRERILSLYRSLLREAGRIPYKYARTFWRLKIRDWFRANTNVTRLELREKKIADRLRDLRRLREAREGAIDSVRWMLQNAYARRGKLRSEIISNIANDPKTPEREAIIPQNPIKSRPPKLPPALVSVFGFTHARRTKPLSPESLCSPPMLPLRADPASEEARLLGPFSLRRKKNIHRRFVREELSRTMPPLELKHRADLISDNDLTAISPLAGIGLVGLERTGVFNELETLAKLVGKPVPHRVRLRETLRAAVGKFIDPSAPNASSISVPEDAGLLRFMRRRFREILAQTPVLTRTDAAAHVSSSTTPKDQWVASLSPLALLRSVSLGKPTSAAISRGDLVWVRRAQGIFPPAKKKN